MKIGSSFFGKLYIFRNAKYQKLFGFGGAFTDAAGINIAKLSSESQKNLIKEYTVTGFNKQKYNKGGKQFFLLHIVTVFAPFSPIILKKVQNIILEGSILVAVIFLTDPTPIVTLKEMSIWRLGT